MTSNASARFFTSSSGPRSAMRSCPPGSAAAAMPRAVSVTRRSGASARPASSQPAPAASTATAPSAIAPCVSSDAAAASRTCRACASSDSGEGSGGSPDGAIPAMNVTRRPTCWVNSRYVTPSSTMPASRNRPP